jgi:hypothetical protein
MVKKMHDQDLERRKAFQLVRIVIKIAAFIPPIYFVIYDVPDIKLWLNDTNAELIRKLSIIFLYLHWILGVNFDLNKQDLVYYGGPQKTEISSIFTLLICTVSLTALLLLLWFTETYIMLTILLAAFWTADAISWCLWRSKTSEYVKKSLRYFRDEDKDKRYLMVLLVNKHIRGKWRAHRILGGYLLLLLIIILCLTQIPLYIVNFLSIGSTDFVLSSAIAIYVLFISAWIDFMRLKILIELNLIKQLEDEYEFSIIRKSKLTSFTSLLLPLIRQIKSR